VEQEIRDRFTGAVEAFARRNSSLGRQGDHSRHKSLEDSFGTSNEAVSFAFSCESK
jgi:casein kinase 1, epsilon